MRTQTLITAGCLVSTPPISRSPPIYAFNTTPNATVAAFGANAGEGALWMGGNGLCVDASNNLYFATANGSFSANTNGGDYADSFVKLSTTNGLAVADYFTPYNQATLAANDTDLGSGGTILLPDSVGSAAHPHLMVGCGKDGILHLVDRDNMGHYNTGQRQSNRAGSARGHRRRLEHAGLFQQSDLLSGSRRRDESLSHHQRRHGPHTHFRGHGQLQRAGRHAVHFRQRHQQRHRLGNPIRRRRQQRTGRLHAYNATNLAQELYNSSQNLAPRQPRRRDHHDHANRGQRQSLSSARNMPCRFIGNSLFLATPVIAPGGGAVHQFVTVTLSDATPDSTIYYTLDGTDADDQFAALYRPVRLDNQRQRAGHRRRARGGQQRRGQRRFC